MVSPKQRYERAAIAVLPAALLAAGLALQPHPAVAQAPSASAPCEPAVSRAIDPLAIMEEGTLKVTTTFRFTCPTGQVRMNVLFLQNGVPKGTGEGSEVPLNENLHNSILGFLDLVDPEKGTRAALAAFTDSYREVIPLGAPGGWPVDWSVWSAPDVGAKGLLAALEHADELLPAGSGAARNVVVAVITSNDPIGTSQQIEQACRGLRAANARLALLDMQQMRGSGGLGELACIDWYFRSLDGEGRDLPAVFMDIAEAVLFTPKVQSVEIVDAMTDAFAYVPRSASPRSPDTDVGNDVTWMFDPPPTEPMTLTYRARAAIGWSAVRTPISREALATFTYSDRSQHTLALPNPPVCIHPRNNPAFCEGGTPTPVFLPALYGRGR